MVMESSYVTLAALLLLGWTIYGAIWRLYLSPLAKIPGPRSVALTYWVEFYYDVIKNGMYMWEVQKMHEKYGPIVRVSPYEVHCIDPEFYNTIYASLPSQRDKYEKFTRSPDCNNATGFTVGHAHHRIRREALAPFFSKRNTLALEKNIRACVDNLFENMRKYKEAKKPFNLTIGSLATSMDILTSYCFGEAFGLLDDETTATKWRDTIFHVMKALPIIRNFPLVARAVEVLPGFLSAAIMPDISVLNGWKSRIATQVEEVLAYKNIYAKTGRENGTLIEQLRDTEKLRPEEKTLQRLSEECSILLIAGSETPAKANAVLWYHLLDNPDRLNRLRAEIKDVYTDTKAPLPSVTVLETLPFLTACILEGMRMQSGVSGRSQRLAPTSLQYGQYTIPARTPMSSISVFQHYNGTIFPDPHSFVPERWLVKNEAGLETINHDLKRYMVAFGHGTRSCLGYNLAWAEMYILSAALATKVDMQLYETYIDDVAIQRDWTIPQPKPDTRGVQVMVQGDVSRPKLR